MAKRQPLKIGRRFGDWVVYQDEQKVNTRHEAVAWFQCRRCGQKVERLVAVVKRSNRCQQCYLKGRKGQRLKSTEEMSMASKYKYNLLKEHDKLRFKKQESERTNAYNKKSRMTSFGRSRQLFHGARQRAITEGVPFMLTKEWIFEKIEAGRCEVTGVTFDFTSPGFNKVNKYAPSLDRTVKERGYTPENTKVVVWFYNTAKNCFSHNELLEFAKVLLRTTKPI